MPINPSSLTHELKTIIQTNGGPTIQTNQQMLQFDLNKHPITLKCRLYIIKAILYRSWDPLGKADPFLKVFLNDESIINDIEGKVLNTLEPVFGKSVFNK